MENVNFEFLKATRLNFIKLIEPLSLSQLNKIPSGFNNNIIWNYGHILAVQYGLTYGLSGQTINFSANFIQLFKKGNKPERNFEQHVVDQLISIGKSNISELETDFNAGKFKQFKLYETSYGVTLKTIEQAINFTAIHEAMHFGYALAQKKML